MDTKHENAVARAVVKGLRNVDVCTIHPFTWKITSIRNDVLMPVRTIVRDRIYKNKG